MSRQFCLSLLPIILGFQLNLLGITDPLPSWNEGNVKNAIIKFVEDTTKVGSSSYVPPEKRIATFDQDGTLWVEQPLYVQLFFAIDRIRNLAPEHPEWKESDHFENLITGNIEALSNLSEAEIEQIVAVTHSGMSVEAYLGFVREWLKTAVHPRFKQPFTSLVYQPMLELLAYFSNNGYKNYLCSGGGQEFMRAYASEVYKIPPERVIGTTGKVRFEYKLGEPSLIKLPAILFVNNFQGKPEGINIFIGQHPNAAFGNSTGDQQMLEWAQASKLKNIQALVHHDDDEREYAYGANSKIGTFSTELMDAAKARGWHIISMKNDWKVIFPWQLPAISNELQRAAQ